MKDQNTKKSTEKSGPPPFHPSSFRLATSRFRYLPDWLIIGGMKCGSSSLFRILEKHPQIAASRRMELRFFDLYWHFGLSWYRAQFDLMKPYGPSRQAGEASPDYLCDSQAPARVRELLPHVKLIAILRDPVERAYSHYNHEIRKGRESRGFMEALLDEERALGQDDRRGERSRAYFFKGCYADHLRRWWSIFDKRQVLVLCSEKIWTGDIDSYRKLSAFLEIDCRVPDGRTRYNAGGYSEAMSRDARAYLQSRYSTKNAELFREIGEVFSWGVRGDDL